MRAHVVSPALLEACLAYAHRHLFEDSEARLLWHLVEAHKETLTCQDTRLLAHLVAAQDHVVALLVERGKVVG